MSFCLAICCLLFAVGSLVAVADFHAANAVAGNNEDQRGDYDQAGHRDPGGSGLGDDRKWPFRNRHWHKGVQIVDNTDLF